MITPSNFKRTIVDISERILNPIARKDLSYPSPCTPDPRNAGKYLCSQDDPANAPEIDLFITNNILNKLLDITQESIESLYFSEVTYEYFDREMQDTKPVEINFYPNLPGRPSYINSCRPCFRNHWLYA